MRKCVAVSFGKTLNAVSHLGAKQSTRCGGPKIDKRHANRTASVLSGMTDTEHSTTSGSIEEEVYDVNFL